MKQVFVFLFQVCVLVGFGCSSTSGPQRTDYYFLNDKIQRPDQYQAQVVEKYWAQSKQGTVIFREDGDPHGLMFFMEHAYITCVKVESSLADDALERRLMDHFLQDKCPENISGTLSPGGSRQERTRSFSGRGFGMSYVGFFEKGKVLCGLMGWSDKHFQLTCH